MGTTPTSITEIAGSARAWRGQILSEARDAGPLGQAVADALGALGAAFDAVMDAKANAAQILSDPSRTRDWKVTQARQTMSGAISAAVAAAQALTSALDTARTKLANAIMPGKPASFDAALAAFQAGEIVKSLEAQPDSVGVVTKAGQILASAIASGDQLTQYIVTGMLGTTFDRLGANPKALYATFAQALRAGDAQRSGTGAALLPYLQAGGSGTLSGLAVAATYAAYNEQQGFESWLAGQLRYSMIQDGVGNVGRE